MKIHVAVDAGSDRPRLLALEGPLVEIGRNPASQVVLAGGETSAVSWRHAQIELRPGGAFLTDCGSTNGTYLNDRRIQARVLLKVGDVIGLGQTGPKLRIAEIEMAKPAAPEAGALIEVVSEDEAFQVSVAAEKPARPARPAAPAGRAMAAAAPGNRPSTTRMMVALAQRNQKRILLGGGLVIGVVGIAIAVVVAVQFWQGLKVAAVSQKAEELAEAAPVSGTKVYEQALKSIALVTALTNNDDCGQGTGSLVDRDRRLFLTAHHVVADSRAIVVQFPCFDSRGELIRDNKYYADNVAKAITARVLEMDRRADLAVLQLDSVPDDAPVLKLASESAKPGEQVHTVGNPALAQVLWTYSHGAVRQVSRLNIHTGGEPWVVQTQNPINHGDSGGPLLNDRCELVGVNQGAKVTKLVVGVDAEKLKQSGKVKPESLQMTDAALNYHIDIREARKILDRVGWRE